MKIAYLAPRVLLFLASAASAVANDFKRVAHHRRLASAQKYKVLGVNSISRLDFAYNIYVDDDGMYELDLRFKHDPTLPVGDTTTCQPGVMAPDGKPYLEGRWMWQDFPDYIRMATGMKHISFDWNACGHQGSPFTNPHYDVHAYLVSPDERLKMTCTVMPSGECDPMAPQDAAGRKMFLVQTSIMDNNALSNMPPDYASGLYTAVQYMGTHALNVNKVPATPAAWTEPVYIILTYDAAIVAVEPMIPAVFVNGTKNMFIEESFTIVQQTIATLPTYYSVAYNATSKITTVTFRGGGTLM